MSSSVATSSPLFARRGKSRPRRRSVASSLSGACLIVVLVAAWVALAPTQFGGRAAYVIVNGNSMEPGLHLGDLVIVREADASSGGYQVGDAVAYRHPDIGPVIHRIVGQEGDRFVMKGDNNSWLDSHRPTPSEIIGKSWIPVPSVGKLMGQLRSPGGMAALAGIMGVIAMTAFVTTKEPGKLSRRGRPGCAEARGPGSKGSKGAGPARSSGEGAQGAISVLAAVLLASLLLGVFAFTRPASLSVSDAVGYEHTGEFSYSAKVPSDIYDAKRVRTGEPVFRKLTNTVDVRFDYRFASQAPTDGVEGTYRLVAEVSDESGWKRTIVLRPNTQFDDGAFAATATLDLARVQRAVDRLEKETGTHSDRYTVTVVPQVVARGTFAGQELEDEFSPKLVFWFDKLKLQLQSPAGAPAGADPQQPSAEGADPLKPSEEGSVERSSEEPNTLSILFFTLGVPTARLLSLLGLALSAGCLLWLGIPMLRALRGDEPERIRARYGPLLVSVNGGDLGSGGGVVEVASFEDLARLAEGSGRSILHRESEGVYDYYLQEDSEVTYHYRAVGQGFAKKPQTTEDRP